MELSDSDDEVLVVERVKKQDDALSVILGLVPDVLPSHAATLLAAHDDAEDKLHLVLNELLEDSSYPKSATAPKGKKRKRSASVDEDDTEVYEPGERRWLSWMDSGEPPEDYKNQALQQLFDHFDRVGKATIRSEFRDSQQLYATTFSALEVVLEQEDDERGWSLLKTKRLPPKGKGKAPAVTFDFEKERGWMQRKAVRDETARKKKEEELLLDAIEPAECECGCCFTEFRFSAMVQCTEAHLFCVECATMQAKAQIGMSQAKMTCMNEDCSAIFSEEECARFLPRSSFKALQKLKQQEEIINAGLEGLETCPFCPFAIIVENPDERLFRCQKDGCEVVSCRKCRKVDHLPKTCEEFARMNSLHAVEDAMSEALIRKCPKCHAPYLKTNGCNYITCQNGNCRTGSCYVCQKICPKSPEHFNMNYNTAPGYDKTKCPLFDTDNSADRDFKNIEAARVAAAALVAENDEELSAADLEKLRVTKDIVTRGQQLDAGLVMPLIY